MNDKDLVEVAGAMVAEGKGIMKLACIKPAIKEVFKITKLDKVFEIHDTHEACMNAFKTKKFGLF